MKKFTIVLFAFLMVLACEGWGQTTIDFETAGDGYTPSGTEGSGYTDVFNRSNPDVGGNSSYMWAVEDITLSNPSITLDQISITGAITFLFSIDMIAHHYNDWDDDDELLITYSIDGGSYENLLWVENAGATFNQTAALDTDFDGDGECDYVLPALTTGESGCTVLSSTFETFSSSTINLSDNSTLDIKLQFNGLTSADEGIYLDNIVISQSGGSTPLITLSTSSLTGFTYVEGAGPSTEQTFTVEGSDLTNNISLTAPTNYEISETSGSGYTSPITLTQSGGTVSTTTIYTRLKASLSAGDYNSEDITASSSGASSKTVTCSGTVYKGEPTNHVTGFSAGTTTSSSIQLSWTENDGAIEPDGYLIKASTVSVSDPVDGTDPADDTDLTDGNGNVKVAHGTTNYTFDNCSSLTTYYFKIYPYTNSGANIDYKTDETPPSANATTEDPPAVPDLIISEVADPNDVYQARFIELYNSGTSVIDFDTETWYLCRQTNGGNWEDKQLTGSIAPSEAYVAANSNGDTDDYFYQNFGFMADYDFGGSSGNGDDGYFLYLGGDHLSGTLIDAYGVIGEDGSGKPWEYEDSKAIRKNTVTTPNATWTASEWNIVISCPTERMTPASYPVTVWNGSTGTSWTSEDNWDNGLSSSTINVKIWSGVTNNPTIMSSAECNKLTIESGTVLTISADNSLEVSSTLTNNAGITGLILKSDESNGNATLIHSTADVSATVENYFTGVAESWHLLSSPVASQEISGDFTPAGTYDDLTGYDFFMWYEQTEDWVNFKNTTVAPTWNTANGSNNFVAGRGYLVSYQATNPTKSFTGNLNQGLINYALTTSGTGSYASQNLAGNPYPSSIDWKAGSGWTRSNLAPNGGGYDLHIYNASAGNYGSYNSNSGGDNGTNGVTRYIPPCQGFMVNASGAGNLTMDNNVRVTNNKPFVKASSELANYLKLKVETNGLSYSDETIIEFGHSSNEGGAAKMFSFVQEAPSLYTLKEGKYYTINFQTILDNDFVIPLYFKAGIDGNYSISSNTLHTFSDETDVILEDAKTGNIQKLNLNSVYNFQANTTDNYDRFKLHFKSATGINENDNNNFDIYSNNCTVYIINPKFVDANVIVYNIMGQEIDNMKINGDEFKSFQLDVKQGYYIVKVISDQSISTEKVYIK